ncbi:zinc-ribbon domain-containing protein [Candidatus Thorarchaeota archaeon]|nr:MAG: zinc-ribbon domain-containing protein [Candidatus Thorarchaeota archaeon]
MVRQIALDFLFKKTKTKIIPDTNEAALAMAFILAESNKKGKAKLRFLSQVTIPFWIVQVSDSNSIVLSSIGESSVNIELSEDTATGPVRRILNTEISKFEDIPAGVDKALPLLKTVEPKVHQLRNIQEPELFVVHGQDFEEVDPNAKLNNLELKIDSQLALTISQNFQEVLEGARQRLGTMEQLQKITKERLTDQLKVMENVISSEMARWEKRLKTQEESSALRIEKLQTRLSDKSYRLREKHQKDRRALLAQLTRDTVELERFFNRILDDIKTSRESLVDIELEDAIERYRSLTDDLANTVPTYSEVVDSINDLAQAAILSAGDLDSKLAQDIRDEEESVNAQIRDIQQQLEEMREERDAKEREFKNTKSKVQTSIESMDGMVEKRFEDLKNELQQIQRLTLDNDSIKGLAPLTLVHFRTWIATYTTGNPTIFAPILVPEDRIDIPYNHLALDEKLEKFLKKLVNDQLKDSASFVTSFRDACDNSNVLKNPESVKAFKKGIDDLWSRQLLKEGVRERLEPLYTTLAGRCPECKAEISENSKFCPECGKSLK